MRLVVPTASTYLAVILALEMYPGILHVGRSWEQALLALQLSKSKTVEHGSK